MSHKPVWRALRLLLLLCAVILPYGHVHSRTEPEARFITTVAGGGSDRVLALNADVGTSHYLTAVDSQGSFYIPVPALGPPLVCQTFWWTTSQATPPTHVQRVDPQGRLTIVAGDGRREYAGDGGPALAARFDDIAGTAIDAAGNLFISSRSRIRRVDAATGIITTIAGIGVPGYGGDGGLGTQASIDTYDLDVDGAGNVYALDASGRVRRIDAVTGIITTVAGNGVQAHAGDGGLATQASLNGPQSLAVDEVGNIFVSEFYEPRIRAISAATGIISTVAGTGVSGFSGDGGPAAQANISDSYGMAADGKNLYLSDWRNSRIRRVDLTTGIIDTVALLQSAAGVQIAGEGVLLVRNTTGGVYRVDLATGLAERIAGGADADEVETALGTRFNSPMMVAAGPEGDVYVTDYVGRRVRRVGATSGIIATVAGRGNGGDGTPALTASVRYVSGLAVDRAGNVYLSETTGDLCTPRFRVRRIDATTGLISTAAGNGIEGFDGDGGPATAASLDFPMGLATDSAGNLFIADTLNRRVRRVNAVTGIITTVAGNGQAAYGGDGGPATSASFTLPMALAFDTNDHLFIADATDHRIRRVDAVTGIISTVAGNGVAAFSGDDGPAVLASLNQPHGVAVDSSGKLYIADRRNHRIRQVDLSTGIITTLSGDGVRDFRGDTGPVKDARFDGPSGVAVGPDDSLFVADSFNNRVRRISALPSGAGSVPCEDWTPEKPLELSRSAGILTLSWGSSCMRSDQDYAVYQGSMGHWSESSPLSCSTGGARTLTLPTSTEDMFYIVVPRNLTREGSYGRSSDGLERAPSPSACLPQEIAASP